jgi:ADP-ribose pyrophosphatase YjhB (NUDIX family)
MVTQTAHYCYRCGAALQVIDLENRPREACPRCGWVHYEQLKVGAGMLIETDGKVLLVQRANDPWKDAWCLPAGYVEADEHPECAARRETLEETGLITEAGLLVGAYFFDDDPRGNGLLLIYEGRVTGGEFTTNLETRAARFFSWGDLPSPFAGGAHDHILEQLQAQRLAGKQGI